MDSRFLAVAFLLFGIAEGQTEARQTKEYEFVIEKTWDRNPVPESDQVKMSLLAAENGKDVTMRIHAPFYNDPPPSGEPGEPTLRLWEHEVVEAFFLNEDNLYLQMEISPFGHHLVILENGKRNYIESFLPLNLTATIQNSSWTAEATIPAEYFPPLVTKISVASMNGLGKERNFLTLTPSPVPTNNPDFHNIEYFQPFDFGNVIMKNENTLSQLWKNALQNEFNYTVLTTWEGKILPVEDRINVTIYSGGINSTVLKVRVEAPFYDDPKPLTTNDPLHLWDNEVVEIYLGNDEGNYFEVQLNPHDTYLVKLFNVTRNSVQHTFPMEASFARQEAKWICEIVIPIDYLPPKVSKFNIGAMHGIGEQRQYNILAPTFGNTDRPDFHDLATYRPLVLKNLKPDSFPNELSFIWKHALKGERAFQISKTWDGEVIPEEEQVLVVVQRIESSGETLVRVESPFYNDPPPSGPQGKNYRGLYVFEVVDVFFVNKDNQYFQIEFSPHGNYFCLLINGTRNVINRGLPLEVVTTIEGKRWTAQTTVPKDYLPPKVRKFSASAAHGVDEARKYITLHPSQSIPPVLDFHNLQDFQRFDIRKIGKTPTQDDSAISPLWKTSLEGVLPFTIETTWEGKAIPENERVSIGLKAVENSADILMTIDAPFYDDPAPAGEPGQPFLGLWDYEVVEAFFLNDNEQYLEVEVSPHGQHIVLLLNGTKNDIKTSLPLNVTTRIDGSRWTGEAIIPRDYFPPKVSRFNAYSINGVEPNRRYLSLYPTDGSTKNADFHNLSFFRPIHIGVLNKGIQDDSEYTSSVWEAALAEKNATISA